MTAVTFRDYALGCVGFIPGTLAFVFIGTTASGILGDSDDGAEEDEGSSLQLIILIVGGIATVVAVVLLSIYAKRALDKVLEEEREEESMGDINAMGGMAMVCNVEAQDGTRPAVLDHAVKGSSRV